jgi:Glycosyl transferase family 2
MIRRRLARAVDWRLRAVIGRLDRLTGEIERLHARLAALDARTEHVSGRLEQLALEVAELRRVASGASQTADATRTVVEGRLEPAVRAILDEERANRRRLYRARNADDYGAAYADADPLVSVTIATAGRPELVERALPSILAQSHANLEILVVGDACDDGVGHAVGALGDPRVDYANLTQRVTAHPDAQRNWLVGSTMARNDATRRARGLWLLHFDDDDRLRPDAVASLLERARSARAEVAYGGFECHRPEAEPETLIAFPPAAGSFGWQGALVHAGLRFFERELVAAHLNLPGDVYMLERMLRAGVRFAMVPEVVWDYYPSWAWGASAA